MSAAAPAGRRPPATPLERAPEGLAPGREVWLVREDLHELGAFKWRGALPVLEAWRASGARAVVTASTGNHGAATAWAARRVGLEAIVYAPASASRAKIALIESRGARVRLEGDDFDDAKERAAAFAASRQLPLFVDGAEPGQYQGYGTIAEEILDRMERPPAAVVVPVGNGALLGGIGTVLGRRARGTLRVGVVAKEAPVMALSWEAGRAVPCDRCATFADGMAVRVAIPRAVEVLRGSADRMIRVPERAIARGVGAFARSGLRVEGAAGAALAALDSMGDVRGPIVLVVTGRNIDPDLHERATNAPETFPD